MVWYFALLAIAVPVIVVLAKKYYKEKKAESDKKNFCFECKKAYPENYVLCPKCGIKFGT
jgi:uncharacterized paraquat-inducible protein A